MRRLKCIVKVMVVAVLIPTTFCCNKVNDTQNPTITVSTMAGSTKGFADGSGNIAQFYSPAGVCVDALGNVYVADKDNDMIRKISPSGMVSTLAGSSRGYADGSASTAKFFAPTGVCVDLDGNVYVADMSNHRIRKITPNGVVSTLAGSSPGFAEGSGSAAKFYYPVGLCVDLLGNIYVAEEFNNRIRKITPAGVVSTFAGSGGGNADGNASTAKFNNPTGICIDLQGNFYVTDYSSNRIRKITPAGMVSTLAGSTEGFADGTGTAALFDHPFGLCVDKQGNIYIADMWNSKIRKITPVGEVSTFTGSVSGSVDGNLNTALLVVPVASALILTEIFI
ncbi:MAG: NHL repeat-containing protein [Bacteroidota bacterium]